MLIKKEMMVMKRKNVFLVVLVLLIILMGIMVTLNMFTNLFVEEEGSFSVDSVVLKSGVVLGDGLVKNIKIMNGEVAQNFEVVSSLDFVLVDVSSFNLGVGEEKRIVLNFSIEGLEEGLYFGRIVVEGEYDKVEIPVILEIESDEVLFDSVLSVPVEYGDVYVGEELVVEAKLVNLENIGSKRVGVQYFVRGVDGKSVFLDEGEMVVESQILNTKVVKISDYIEEGVYLFGVVVKYEDSVGVSSHFFEVEKREVNFFDGEIPYIWVAFILLLIIVLYILYILSKRDKYLVEIDKQYKENLKREVAILNAERRRLLNIKSKGDGGGRVKSNKKLKELKIRERKTVKKMKNVYKARKGIVRKLKLRKKPNEIKRKLSQWSKEGYNVSELVPGDKFGLRESVRNAKRQGYGL